MKLRLTAFIALIVCAVFGVRAEAIELADGEPDSDRTTLAVLHTPEDWRGLPNAHEPRPALSLAKLHLGYWVLLHGTAEEKGKVVRMTQTSSDALAVELDENHPHAVDKVAELFGLEDTSSDGYWGRAETSAYDMARFVYELLDDPVAEPLLRGMAEHAPYAEDGFKQDFGTDQMPGVIGSKFGWTDDLTTAFASVSFGPDFVVAAFTFGDVDEHTDDIHAWVDKRRYPFEGTALYGEGPLPADQLPAGVWTDPRTAWRPKP